MTSYDKVVKLACKPKAAPPKAKYLDQILAATWLDEGAVHDVCKALAPRFREPNAIIVFKALLVLHTMIRTGATDNVLRHLSTTDVLRLQNVSTGNWEGYNAPQNLQHYAVYLDARIRAYRDLKHDAVRVQAESNRDMRMSTVILDPVITPKKGGASGSAGPTRSQTVMGRKLKVMTVEKGLLRETKAVLRTIDALVECRFYLDNLEDELTISALRMLVKDLIILFQACNEGVINVLEHYFEMSHIDAKEALKIYRHFCKQSDRVSEYLDVAKKLQNLLSIPIPQLKQAPLSLAGSLQEYLDDPNFENNRREYRANKEAANKAAGSSMASPSSSTSPASSTAKGHEKNVSSVSGSIASPPLPPQAASARTAGNQRKSNEPQDLLSSIEEEQQPKAASPTVVGLPQPSPTNPFALGMTMGSPFGQPPGNTLQQANPFGQSQVQPVPLLIPQHTVFMPVPPRSPSNPFSTGSQSPPNAFLHTQHTSTFLQPQATGANPFRQSMLFPQTTGGMPLFAPAAINAQAGLSNGSSPFQATNLAQNQIGTVLNDAPSSASSSLTPFSGPNAPSLAPPPSAPPIMAPLLPGIASNTSSSLFQNQSSANALSMPPRPASTPLKNTSDAPKMEPVKTHQTGSRNPFGVPVFEAPPVPKAPTLMELATKGSNGEENADVNATAQQGTQARDTSNANQGLAGTGSDMASVASSLLNLGKASESSVSAGVPSLLNPQHTATTASGLTRSDSLFSSLSSELTGKTSISRLSSLPSLGGPSALVPQSTGFGGIKPFKPSSSFGASLLESLPPIPQSTLNTPAVTGAFNTSGQPLGAGNSSLGVGLRPQMTGGPNPFRASMFVTGSNPFAVSLGQPQSQPLGSPPVVPLSAGATSNAQVTGFGRPWSPPASAPPLPQSQQDTTPSLI